MCDKLSPVITKVEINLSIQKELDRDIKKGLFKPEVRELVAFWRREVMELGFVDYLQSPLALSLNDHELSSERYGERSIYLNENGGRLIYKFYKNKIIVQVIKITPKHDYS